MSSAQNSIVTRKVKAVLRQEGAQNSKETHRNTNTHTAAHSHIKTQTHMHTHTLKHGHTNTQTPKTHIHTKTNTHTNTALHATLKHGNKKLESQICKLSFEFSSLLL